MGQQDETNKQKHLFCQPELRFFRLLLSILKAFKNHISTLKTQTMDSDQEMTWNKKGLCFKFQRSNRGIDDLLSHGNTILENLRDQRSTLKNVQRRMLDVASTLGMSSTVMRLIERRQESDKYILFGGMLVTCIIMFLIVRYFT